MNHPGNQAVKDQLAKILNSSYFSGSPRLSEFFKYVIEKTLDGRQDQIKAYSIAVDVFKRGEDFSSAIDPIVRIQAGRLRRSLDLYYSKEGAEDTIIISIPKGRYIPEFLSSTDKSKLEIEEIDKSSLNLHSEINIRSEFPRMIVLPFINNSGDQSLDYFGYISGEELSSEFSHFRDLEMVSFHTASQLAEDEQKLTWLSENLGVDFVLRGKFHKVDQSILININLYETINKTQIWTRKIRTVIKKEGLESVVSEVSAKVISFLAGSYGLISRNLWESASQQKYSSLHGRRAVYLYRLTQINVDAVGHEKAEDEIHKAVAADPGFAMGWATLGEIQCDYYSRSLENRHQFLNNGLAYIDKAMQIDPCLQYIYHVKTYACLHQKDADGARIAAQRTCELNPNESYLTGMAGYWISLIGDFEKGIPLVKKSLKRNPYYPTYMHHAIMLDHIDRGEYEKAVKEAIAFNHPQYFWSHLDKAAAYGLHGDINRASVHYKKLIELLPSFVEYPLEFLRIFVCVESLQDKMMKGLKAAGLK